MKNNIFFIVFFLVLLSFGSADCMEKVCKLKKNEKVISFFSNKDGSCSVILCGSDFQRYKLYVLDKNKQLQLESKEFEYDDIGKTWTDVEFLPCGFIRLIYIYGFQRVKGEGPSFQVNEKDKQVTKFCDVELTKNGKYLVAVKKNEIIFYSISSKKPVIINKNSGIKYFEKKDTKKNHKIEDKRVKYDGYFVADDRWLFLLYKRNYTVGILVWDMEKGSKVLTIVLDPKRHIEDYRVVKERWLIIEQHNDDAQRHGGVRNRKLFIWDLYKAEKLWKEIPLGKQETFEIFENRHAGYLLIKREDDIDYTQVPKGREHWDMFRNPLLRKQTGAFRIIKLGKKDFFKSDFMVYYGLERACKGRLLIFTTNTTKGKDSEDNNTNILCLKDFTHEKIKGYVCYLNNNKKIVLVSPQDSETDKVTIFDGRLKKREIKNVQKEFSFLSLSVKGKCLTNRVNGQFLICSIIGKKRAPKKIKIVDLDSPISNFKAVTIMGAKKWFCKNQKELNNNIMVQKGDALYQVNIPLLLAKTEREKNREKRLKKFLRKGTFADFSIKILKKKKLKLKK